MEVQLLTTLLIFVAWLPSEYCFILKCYTSKFNSIIITMLRIGPKFLNPISRGTKFLEIKAERLNSKCTRRTRIWSIF